LSTADPGVRMQGARGAEREHVGASAMIVLLCSNPFMGLMFTAVGPVLPGLTQAFAGHGDAALNAQLVMTVPGIGIILAGAPIGWLTQRLGAARVVRWALAGFALSGAAGMVIQALPALLASRFILGVCASAIATSTLAIVGERFHDDVRARVLSYQAAAGAAFGFVSLLLSGAVAEAWGWRASFGLYLLAAVVLLCALLSLPVTAATRSPATESASHTPGGSLKPLLPVFALIVVIFIAVFMNAVQASFLLAADGYTSPSVQSWVLAAGAISNSAGALSFGWIRPRLGARWTFAGCLLCMGVGFAILGLGGAIAMKLLGIVIASIGAGCVGPYVGNLLLDRAAPQVRARAAGLLYSATFVGDFLNPLAVAPLRHAFGIHGAFIVVGAVCAASALFVAVRRIRA
jgi:MFS family permease